MFTRTPVLLLAAVGLALFVCQPALAADAHEGKVVEAGAGKLTMTDKDGKNQHTHEVAKDATVTVDGKASKLEDLKAGFPVTVTIDMTAAGKKVATKVEAKTK